MINEEKEFQRVFHCWRALEIVIALLAVGSLIISLYSFERDMIYLEGLDKDE